MGLPSEVEGAAGSPAFSLPGAGSKGSLVALPGESGDGFESPAAGSGTAPTPPELPPQCASRIAKEHAVIFEALRIIIHHLLPVRVMLARGEHDDKPHLDASLSSACRGPELCLAGQLGYPYPLQLL